MWHCTEKAQTELEDSELGRFFSSDSYVVLYRRADKKESYIMYFWMGASARAVWEVYGYTLWSLPYPAPNSTLLLVMLTLLVCGKEETKIVHSFCSLVACGCLNFSLFLGLASC